MTDLSPERLSKLLEEAKTDTRHFYTITDLAPDLARQRIADAKRIAELEDELYDAKQAPWPAWAKSMLDILDGFTDNAYTRSGDPIDLPEEMQEWLGEYRTAVEMERTALKDSQ